MKALLMYNSNNEIELYKENKKETKYNHNGNIYISNKSHDKLYTNNNINKSIEYKNYAYNYNINDQKERKNNMYSIIKKYFNDVSHNNDSITLDKNIMNNMPTIKGTRIPVINILASLRDDMSIDEISEAFNLKQEQIEDAVDFAISILEDIYLEDEE